MRTALLVFLLASASLSNAQVQADSTLETPIRKNIVRYNLSGAMFFGIDKYIVLGYERIVGAHQSFSVNFGSAALPKALLVSTDSFEVKSDKKNSGFNFSVDYRFYLAKENKFLPPHGLYIGPYYSFNKFKRDNLWEYKNSAYNNDVTTSSNLTIHTLGIQLGYQFLLWKRVTLDMVMVGPGLGIYEYQSKFEGNLNTEQKEQIKEGLQQLITQKFPGMNFVFSDKQIDGKGVMKANALGYRFIVHVGFNF